MDLIMFDKYPRKLKWTFCGKKTKLNNCNNSSCVAFMSRRINIKIKKIAWSAALICWLLHNITIYIYIIQEWIITSKPAQSGFKKRESQNPHYQSWEHSWVDRSRSWNHSSSWSLLSLSTLISSASSSHKHIHKHLL